MKNGCTNNQWLQLWGYGCLHQISNNQIHLLRCFTQSHNVSFIVGVIQPLGTTNGVQNFMMSAKSSVFSQSCKKQKKLEMNQVKCCLILAANMDWAFQHPDQLCFSDIKYQEVSTVWRASQDLINFMVVTNMTICYRQTYTHKKALFMKKYYWIYTS